MKIGIIGGAGVAATNKLNELIEVELTKNGAFRDCHHPEIIIWQATNAPSRSMFLEGKGKSFVEDYVEIAKQLKNCGCRKIFMCCNTAHFAIDEISQKANIEIVNLVQNVVQEVSKKKVNSVGLVVSDGCLKGKVYEKYFKQICPEVKIIYPNEVNQELVTKGICNIKNIHRFDSENSDERPKKIFKQVKEQLQKDGAEIVIMGCTDIRVDYYENENIDSLEVLKKVILAEIHMTERENNFIPVSKKIGSLESGAEK